MNYLDLFAGIGGFHQGLLEAGIKFEWCGFSEIDKYAKQIYKNHFPGSEDLGDVRTIDADRLPRIDLITFGFPCQDLSMAGKRRGLKALRSGLFFEAMRIVRAKRPRYFEFENVMGLFSKSPAGNVYERREWFLTILREIADAGYDGQWQVLNTCWFLPHDRERIYFVGHRRGEPRPQIFPITEGDEEFVGENRTGRKEGVGLARSLDANYHKGPDGKRTHLILRDNWGGNIKQRIKDIDQPVWTLGGSETVIYQRGHGFNEGGVKKICPALSSHSLERNNFLTNGDLIRALTPLEFERLHGFPDNWTAGVSDTQRYKMLGNAVSVPVVKIIGERLINGIDQNRVD